MLKIYIMTVEYKQEIDTYIKQKNNETQGDSIIWVLNEFHGELNSLVWQEKKENDDWPKLFEWLKNDEKLLKYAELYVKQAKGETLRWSEDFRMTLLWLRLSVTCTYFEDFKLFLDDLIKWEYVPELDSSQDWWQIDNSARMWWSFCWVNVNSIQSSPYYKNPTTWVTWCAHTAVLNGKNFWLDLPGWHAYDAWVKPGDGAVDTIPRAKKDERPSREWAALQITEFNSINNDANFADMFVQSDTVNWKKYGHRAVAFRDSAWQWFVLDPYIRVNWRLDNSPKKLEDYMKVRNVVKAHFYKSTWYVWEIKEMPTLANVEQAVNYAIDIANNDAYWYVSWWKWENNNAKWYDCCGLVCSVFEKAWFGTWFTNCVWMKDAFQKKWFKWVKYDRNNLKRWDILLNNQHTELYIWDGKTVWAHKNVDWKDWDSGWDEISLTDGSYFLSNQYHRDWVLRYEW